MEAGYHPGGFQTDGFIEGLEDPIDPSVCTTCGNLAPWTVGSRRHFMRDNNGEKEVYVLRTSYAALSAKEGECFYCALIRSTLDLPRFHDIKLAILDVEREDNGYGEKSITIKIGIDPGKCPLIVKKTK